MALFPNLRAVITHGKAQIASWADASLSALLDFTNITRCQRDQIAKAEAQDAKEMGL